MFSTLPKAHFAVSQEHCSLEKLEGTGKKRNCVWGKCDQEQRIGSGKNQFGNPLTFAKGSPYCLPKNYPRGKSRILEDVRPDRTRADGTRGKREKALIERKRSS